MILCARCNERGRRERREEGEGNTNMRIPNLLILSIYIVPEPIAPEGNFLVVQMHDDQSSTPDDCASQDCPVCTNMSQIFASSPT